MEFLKSVHGGWCAEGFWKSLGTPAPESEISAVVQSARQHVAMEHRVACDPKMKTRRI